MIASLSMFGSSNSVKGSVVSMTVRAHNTIRKISISLAQSPRAFTAHRHTMSALLDVLLVLERALAVALCRHCFVRSFVRSFASLTKSFLSKVAWEGGTNTVRGAPAGETEGRKGAGEGWVHIREPASYFPMSSALSYPAPWKGEKEDKGVAHAHAEGRGVHEKTRTCAVSISLHPAR